MLLNRLNAFILDPHRHSCVTFKIRVNLGTHYARVQKKLIKDRGKTSRDFEMNFPISLLMIFPRKVAIARQIICASQNSSQFFFVARWTQRKRVDTSSQTTTRVLILTTENLCTSQIRANLGTGSFPGAV